jgi:penicillin G amidase
MVRQVKFVVGLTIVGVIVLASAALLSIKFLKKSLPQTTGTVTIDGLRSIVKIYRDDCGVPHIYANNEDDLFFAMGYATAQDRFWQMDLARRTAQGTLSEIFGTITIPSDKLYRILGIYSTAQQIIPKLSTESRIVLEQYTAGINAYLNQKQRQLGIEFSILNYKPDPWKIEDCIACLRLFAFQTSRGWNYDLISGAMIDTLGYQTYRELFSEPIPTTSNKTTALPMTEHQPYFELLKYFHTIPNLFPKISGSNSWVVSGAKSLSGKPLLAAAPHAQLRIPSPFYEIHLNAPFINCYGFTVPSVPVILQGRNQAIAWNFNDMSADDLDFYLEKINGDEFLYKNSWAKLETDLQLIPVRGQPAETLYVKKTIHGPLISELLDINKSTTEGIAVKWTGFELSDEIYGYYLLLKTSQWNSFTVALNHIKIPAQNAIYADTSGNIGSYGAGNIPIRNNFTGEFPMPGETGLFEWSGTVPYDKLPSLFNPPENQIISAGINLANSKYPYFISNYWEPGYRANRIRELLTAKEKHHIDDFKKYQTDEISKHAELITPILQEVMKTLDITDDFHNYFYDTIKQWDYRYDPITAAPTIFQVFFMHLIDNTFHDELGDELYKQFIQFPSVPIRALDQVLLSNNLTWFDNKNTPEPETKEEIILKSLNDTYNYLVQKYGTIVDDWRWGKVHGSIYTHPLNKYQTVKTLLDRGPFLIGGENSTINYSSYSFAEPFTTIFGTSGRIIFDLSSLDRSAAILSTGESGQDQDEHYQDQIQLFLSGKYHPVFLSEKKVKQSNYNVLTLKQAGR